MSFKTVLFPEQLRNLKGGRWIRISLRTWHLLSMGFLVGQTATGIPMTEQPWALWGTVASGVLFIGMELATSFIFLIQLKGLAVLAKMLLLGAAVASPDNAVSFMVAAIIIGGISSHMPGAYRYYSVFHGRVIKE